MAGRKERRLSLKRAWIWFAGILLVLWLESFVPWNMGLGHVWSYARVEVAVHYTPPVDVRLLTIIVGTLEFRMGIRRGTLDVGLAAVVSDETPKWFYSKSFPGLLVCAGVARRAYGHGAGTPSVLEKPFLVSPVRHYGAQLNLAIPLMALGIAYVVQHLRHRRASKSKSWKCQSCTYDLTGNTSGRCPECGTPIETRSTGCSRSTNPP